VRCFVAVWPPDDVLDDLAALPRPAATYARWSTRDQWHVTLRFFGELDEAGVAAATQALSDAAGSFGASPARSPDEPPGGTAGNCAGAPAGSPGTLHKPHNSAGAPAGSSGSLFVAHGGPATRFMGPGLVVWPVEGLDDLARALQRATAEIGKPAPHRQFHGHVTLARARGDADLRRTDLGHAGRLLAPLQRSWPVGSFALVESRLRPGGSVYTDFATFSLASPAPGG
jgi:2'-5' RNA ligase